MLYHVSTNPNLNVLKPRIPKSAIEGYEDTTTPRVCFSTSINGCLNAIIDYDQYDVITEAMPYVTMVGDKETLDIKSFIHDCSDIKKLFMYDMYDIAAMQRDSNRDGKYPIYPFYYVYIPTKPKRIFIPKIYDRPNTDEIWVMEPIKVQRVGGIFVTNRVPTGPTYKTKTVKGETINCHAFAYEYVKTPPDYIF